MFYIAIVEKDPLKKRELTRRAESYFSRIGLTVSMRSFGCGDELLKDGHCYELVFYDPEAEAVPVAGPDAGSCLGTAIRLREKQRAGFFLFVAGSAETAWETSGIEAADCLSYPADAPQFEGVLDRILARLQSKETGCIRIPSPGHSCRILFYKDICFCEALSHRTSLHTRNGGCECRYPLKELKALLGGRFFQCHRRMLVNLDWVRGYEDGCALLLDGSRLPVARSRRQDFLQAVLSSTSCRK